MFMAIDNPPENAFENVGWINNKRRGNNERSEYVYNNARLSGEEWHGWHL